MPTTNVYDSVPVTEVDIQSAAGEVDMRSNESWDGRLKLRQAGMACCRVL